MQIKASIPVLACYQLENTLAFYQQALNCIIVGQRDGSAGREWIHLKTDNIFLMLVRQAEKPLQSDVTDKNLFYYYTDDVDAYYRFVRARGFKPTDLQTTEYGMKEFFLVDPEGNRLAIGQSIK
ncbi:MAG: VOC family protein [Gammaproteobacteria bacterium]|nr:VOC family protein [Gammaproteobacteria bacterium]